jgi:serine/threonine-protein kinase RsbW
VARGILVTLKNRTIELKIPSEHGYEKMAMQVAAELAEMMGFSPERTDDVRTAVSEACINAMEHGNALDGETKVFVVMTAGDERLAIDVIDEGHSDPPQGEFAPPDLDAQFEGRVPPGGMGLFVIKALVDEADFVEPELGVGNQFRMVIRLQSEGVA